MTQNNLIIVVGRQVGSGGLFIAQQLCEKLQCTLYDRRLLNMAAQESGFDKSFFERIDEQKGFLKWVSCLHIPGFTDDRPLYNDLSDESLYRFQSDVIQKAAQQGNSVFVGRTADYVLRNTAVALNVFITAPLNDRITRVAETLQMSNEEAAKYIREKEKHRAEYYNYYTGRKWGAANNYDLCIDSSLLGIDRTADLLAQIATERHSKQK